MTTQSNDQAKLATQQPAEGAQSGAVYWPLADIVEQGDELLLVVDLPGVNPDDLYVHFEDKSLTIHGRATPRQDEAQTNYLLREYGVGDFHRAFQVSEDIDTRQISAELKDGVLILHLPKAEAAKPRKILVQTTS